MCSQKTDFSMYKNLIYYKMVSHTSENIINCLTNIIGNTGFYWEKKKVKNNKVKASPNTMYKH